MGWDVLVVIEAYLSEYVELATLLAIIKVLSESCLSIVTFSRQNESKMLVLSQVDRKYHNSIVT